MTKNRNGPFPTGQTEDPSIDEARQVHLFSFEARELFRLYLIDWDKNQFTIEGPLTDTKAWVRAIDEASRSGRKVSCFTAPWTEAENDQAVHAWQLMFSQQYVPPGSIVCSNLNFSLPE